MRMPCVMPDDRSALLACLHTWRRRRPFRAVLIEDTAHIETLWASEALLAEAREDPALTAAGPPRPLPFDGEGALGRSPSLLPNNSRTRESAGDFSRRFPCF